MCTCVVCLQKNVLEKAFLGKIVSNWARESMSGLIMIVVVEQCLLEKLVVMT